MYDAAPREYVVDFRLPGVHTLPPERAQRLAWAFGAALDGVVEDVRVLRAAAGRNKVLCVLVAPSEESVLAAARVARLAPDHVFEVGLARGGPAARGPHAMLAA